MIAVRWPPRHRTIVQCRPSSFRFIHKPPRAAGKSALRLTGSKDTIPRSPDDAIPGPGRLSRLIYNRPSHRPVIPEADARTRLTRYVANAQAIDAGTHDAVLQVFRDSLNQEDAKKYLRDLVDFYGDAVTQPDRAASIGKRPAIQQPSNDGLPWAAYDAPDKETSLSQNAQRVIRQLRALISKDTTHWRTIWDKYLELSDPRIQQLPDGVLRSMLRHLGAQDPESDEIKTGELSAAYSALIDAMGHAQIRIWRKDWNTMMHFYLKSQATVDEHVLAEALRMWQEMENKFHCEADIVTFTILYLAAGKAQKFGVADNVWRQMRARGLLMDRQARIAAIQVGGLRGSRTEITNAYASLVEDGHAVDMRVLNTVAKAFVEAGAISAAEEVLRRVRCISEQASIANLTSALRDWREKRALNKLLKKSPTLSPDAQWHLQAILHSKMILSEQSYIPLIRWYASTNPDFTRLKSILQEMAGAGLAVSPATFLMIFQGFKQQGQSMVTEWSSSALGTVTDIFKQQLVADPRFEQMEAKLPIAAVEACHLNGMMKEARSVWSAAIKKWIPPAWAESKVTALIGRESYAKKLAEQQDEKLEVIFSEAVG